LQVGSEMRALGSMLALVVAACGLTAVDLTGKECPCPDGWHCDPSTQTCAKGSGNPGGTGGTSGSGSSGGTSGSGSSGGTSGSGGSAGSSGLGGVAGSGDGAAGASGGAAGAGGGAAGAPSCLPAPVNPSWLLLHTTLDDAQSVSAPAVGSGPGSLVSLGPGDFIGNALSIDAANEYIFFPQAGGVDASAAAHIDLSQGSIDFCYKPSNAHTDGLEHWLFYVGDHTDAKAGTIRMRKSSSNSLELHVTNDNGAGGVQFLEAKSAHDKYAFAPDTWYRVTATWNLGPGSGTKPMIVYVEETDVTSQWSASPLTLPMPAPSASKFIYIGGDANAQWGNANGMIDDFRIYDHPIVP
jgi:hypothetical protein